MCYRSITIHQPPRERRPCHQATIGITLEQLREPSPANGAILQPVRALHAGTSLPGGKGWFPERFPEWG